MPALIGRWSVIADEIVLWKQTIRTASFTATGLRGLPRLVDVATHLPAGHAVAWRLRPAVRGRERP